MPEDRDILDELKTLYGELKSYKRLLNLKGRLSDKDSLRETLVHKIGALKGVITELTQKQYYTRFGQVREIWADGLSPSDYLPSKLTGLDYCIDATNEAIGRLKADIEMNVRDKQGNVIGEPHRIDTEPPKAFIAHKGETGALQKLKDFLDAIGVQYLIAEVKPSDGRSVEGQVTWTYGQADFAIILATKGGVIDKKTRVPYMGMNVADELGRARVVFKNRIILLLEQGVEPHTNISEIVHERFVPQSMDKAFIKIAKELRNWGFLRAEKIATDKHV